MKDICTAWQIAVRRVWRVPSTTHCNLLPHIAGVMPPELTFAKRAISFTNLLLRSDNKTVNMITGMGLYGKHSILGANARYLLYKYEMKCKVIDHKWKRLCQDQGELIRKSEQIKELCYMRDTNNTGNLSRNELNCIIDDLCTK